MMDRRSERGNIFFMLFGAVALVGVVAASTSTLMRGPLSTVVNVNSRAKADTQMQIAAKLAMVRAAQEANNGDCDSDGMVEPIVPVTGSPAPVGGGLLPASIGAAQKDPWGNVYGYCVWDIGPITDGNTGSCGGSSARLAGGNNGGYPVMVIISSGPDRTFQTQCNAWTVTDPSGYPNNFVGTLAGQHATATAGDVIYKPSGADDMMISYTYSEAVESSGGLWKLKTGDPGKITTDKDLDIQSNTNFASGKTATFQGAAQFQQNSRLDLGMGGMFVLPDQINMASCNSANNGALRLNTTVSSGHNVLEICDFAAGVGAWSAIGGAGTTVAKIDDLLDATANTTHKILFMGDGAGLNFTSGSADNDTLLGINAGSALTTGDNNTILGAAAGALLTTGSGNILIGSAINVPTATTSNYMSIGNTLYGDLSTGNIGIGTASPSTKLQVAGVAQATQFQFDANDYLGYSSGGNMVLATGGSGRVYIGNTGNVGIGTGSPAHPLDVNGDGVFTGDVAADQFYANNGSAGSPGFTFGSGSGGLYNPGSGLGFSVGGSAKALLNTTGFGIGVTPTEALDVGGNGKFSGSVQSGTGFMFSSSNGLFPTGGNLSLNIGGAPKLYITGAGVGVGVTSPNATLDVGGGIKPGTYGVACTNALSGTIRYGSSDAIEYCSSDGTWYKIAASGGGGGGGVADLWTNNTTYISRDSAHIINNGQALPSALTGAGTRFEWYPAKSAFRAGGVSATAWNDGGIGNYSTGLGYDTQAQGDYSLAAGSNIGATGNYSIGLGQNITTSAANSYAIGKGLVASGANAGAIGLSATASGANALAFGLGAAAGAAPIVSGSRSFGIFMGDQSGVTLAGNNTMALLGGNFLVDPAPGLTPAMAGLLNLQVNGNAGAAQYCDNTGAYCFTAASVASGAVGVFENASNVIRLTSGTVSYASADFVFGSPQLAYSSTGAYNTRMLFYKATGALRAGTATGMQWNAANVGANSIGLGYNVTASGVKSVALGDSNTASGYGATALGQTTVASGQDSTAMGSDTTASGMFSTAMGYGVKAPGPFSVAVGLGGASGLYPQVLGAGSYGIFMGDQSAVNLTADATLGLFGGKMVIDPNAPATRLTARGVLDLGAATDAVVMPSGSTAQRPTGVNGMLRYNSANGKFEGYQGGAWQDILTSAAGGSAATPDRGIQFNSGGSFAAASTFTYTSAGNVGIGTASPGAAMDVQSAMDIYSTGPQLRLKNLSGGLYGTSLWLDSTALSGGQAWHIVSSGGTASEGQGKFLIQNGAFNAALAVDTLGYVGLGFGNTAPQAQLDVGGTGAMLLPRGTTAQQPSGINGMLRYNSSNGKFEGYQRGAWQDILTSAAGGSAAAPDRGIQFNSGGSFAASGNLMYSSVGALLVSGTYTGTTTPPASGAGSRMFFDPGRAIFRAGYVSGTQWDYSSSGNYSIATGYNTIASGNNSTAMGVSTTASGGSSTAIGSFTTASGLYSTAIGSSTTASANYSTAMGYGTIASSLISTATGWNTTASGSTSTAMGGSTTAGGNFSTAMGYKMTTAADYSMGVGLGSFASVPGLASTATGSYGIFMGAQTSAVQMASANTMGLFGGSFVIDPNAPATQLSARGVLDLGAATDAIVIPRGTTAQKPSGVNGMIRYNSDNGKFEGFQQGAWQDILTSAAGGSAAAPDRGIQFNSGGSFAAASTFTYTAAGNVGIGTASPASLLSVSGSSATGDLSVTTSSGAGSISVASLMSPNATGDTYFSIGRSLSLNNAALIGLSSTGSSNNYAFMTIYGRPASDFVVSSTGNVGIGTTSPQARLDVSGADSILFPRGDSSTRPATPINGMMRYNSTSGKFEAYQTGAWQDILTSGGGAGSIDSLSDAATNYTAAISASSNSIHSMFLGTGVGASATSGSSGYNTGLGDLSLQSLSSGGYNTAFGYSTLKLNASGANNTAVGNNALSANVIGSYNVAIGSGALASNTSGAYNTANGPAALNANTSGHDNTATGYSALSANTTGNTNTANGSFALASNTTGSNNSADGYFSLLSNTTGSNNTALNSALYFNTTGSSNTAIGYLSLLTNTAKNESTAVGYQAMYYADNSTTSAATNNTALGAYALRGSTTATNNTGTANTALGHSALIAATSGANNTALGYNAGGNLTTGSGNIMIGSGITASSATVSNEINIGNLIGGNYGTGLAYISGSGALSVPIGTTAQQPASPTNGMVRYNSTKLAFEGYQNGGWQVFSSGGGSVAAATPDRGIQFNSGGAFAANSNLVYTASGILMAAGTYTGSPVAPVSGAGTRMFFDPQSASFRAGTVSGSQFNASNMGIASAAFGNDVTASGPGSFAAGTGTVATGYYSTALGQGSTAEGTGSFAVGSGALAHGDRSFATGAATTASGEKSTAMGSSVTTSALNSMVIGLNDFASKPGLSSTATGSYGIFMGAQTSAVQITATNTLGLFGGKFVIDPNAPATQLMARGVLDLGAATDAIVMPIGTTAQQPASPVNGMVRYNSTKLAFEGYQNGGWQVFSSGGAPAAETVAIDNLSDAITRYSSGGMFLGTNVGASNTGQYNTALGALSLAAANTGNFNNAFGYGTLNANTSGANNTATGSLALYANTTGGDNTATGNSALTTNTSGSANVANGSGALNANTIGTGNTAIGRSALYSNVGRSENTAIGYYAMQYANSTPNASVTYNTAIGAYALQGSGTAANNIGTFNTAVGHSAMLSVSSGSYNAGFGSGVLYANTSGSRNVAIGSYGLISNTTGSGNTSLGYNALSTTSTADSNTGIGVNSLALATGNNNTAIGGNAANTLTSGGSNIAIGFGINLASNTGSYQLNIGNLITGDMANGLAYISATGALSVPIGTTAQQPASPTNGMVRYNSTKLAFEGYQNGGWQVFSSGSGSGGGGGSTIDALTDAVTQYSSGSMYLGSGVGASSTALYNTGLGSGSLAVLTTGGYNTAFGNQALAANTTGGLNVAIGTYAMISNTTGSNNTATGVSALYSTTTGNYNTANGQNALAYNTVGSNNTAIGMYSLNASISGNNNSATGYNALYSNTTGGNNTATGMYSLNYNTTGGNNTATGLSALFSNVAKSESTAVGFQAMANADNSSTAAVTYNTGVGAYALQGSGTASANTGTSNTAIGHSSLIAVTSGSNNTAIGYNAGNNLTSGASNIMIGSGITAASATGSNQLNIGGLITGTTNAGLMQIAGTGALTLPIGTTAQQPASPVNGMVRYNSTKLAFEGYQNGGWQVFSSGSGSSAVSLSALMAATAANTLANAANAQVWNWDTLTTGNALTLGSTSVTSGSLLSVAATNAAASAGSALSVSTATTGAGYAINGIISGAGNTGAAVYGNNSSSTGVNYGVNGTSASTGAAYGVYGSESGASNTGYGIYGSNASTSGYGVYSNGAFGVAPPAVTKASAAAVNYATETVTAPTITFTGTTAVTSIMKSFAYTPPTYAGTAVAVSDAAGMLIAGAPVKSGSVTIANTYDLYLQSAAVGAATNSYALYAAANTGAANNYAAAFMGGNVGIKTASPAVSLAVSGTDAILVPVGTTAQQPAAANGLIRYNSDKLAFEGYQNGGWQIFSSGGGSVAAATPDRGIQFNSGGAFAASSLLTYNSVGTFAIRASASNSLTFTGLTSGGTVNAQLYNHYDNAELIMMDSTGAAKTQLSAYPGQRPNLAIFASNSGGAPSSMYPTAISISIPNTLNAENGIFFADGNDLSAMSFAPAASITYYDALSGGYGVGGLNFRTSTVNGSSTLRMQINQEGLITFSSTGAFVINAGTTAQRPVSPVNGMIRYNSSNLNFEGYQNGGWQVFSSGGGGGGSTIDALTDAVTQYSSGSMYLGSGTGASASGANNVALGYQTMQNATTTSSNVAIGTQAMSTIVGKSENTAVGYQAMQRVDSASSGYGQNTAVGAYALQGSGTASANTGSGNTAIGQAALVNNTSGGSNSAVGFLSMIANTTGTNNASLGNGTLYSNTTGSGSTAIGVNALSNATGSSNTALGISAGNNITTGASNIIIGAYAQAPSATASNQLNIGELIYGDTSSNKFVGINKTAPVATLDVVGDIQYTGTITDVSDRRLKTDIAPLKDRGSILEKVGRLGTYSFRMKDDAKKQIEFGVMAQEMKEVFPELVKTDLSTPEHYMSVNYVGMIAPLIQATKELKAENDSLKAELATLKSERDETHVMLEDLTKDVKGLKAHTGYGIGRASFDGWPMILMLIVSGSSAGFFVVGGIKRRRDRM